MTELQGLYSGPSARVADAVDLYKADLEESITVIVSITDSAVAENELILSCLVFQANPTKMNNSCDKLSFHMHGLANCEGYTCNVTNLAFLSSLFQIYSSRHR
jgi:hypothetical protein